MRSARNFAILLTTLLVSWATGAVAQGGGVPVTTFIAQTQDVPITLRAIATVQAFQSVLVRARVDGTLDEIMFTEGQTVKPGDVLAQLDPRPYQALYDQAVAKKAADEAQLMIARQDLVRYAELAQTAVASRQRLEQARATVMQLEAQVRGDDAAIAAAQLNLTFTRITSPINGRVGLRLLDPGNFIRVADNNSPGLVTIAQVQPITVLFSLPQDTLSKVTAAMARGKLPVTAWSSDDREKLSTGELLTIDSTIDTTTGSIRLKSVFANKDNALWPGQFVNARLQLDIMKNAVTIPSVAIQRGMAGLYVFVVRPDQTAAVQLIEVAQEDSRMAVVSKGLAAGDRVVLTGQSRLTNGTRVAATDQKPAS